jgi:glycine cleavage system H lipoate-binding protein
LESNQALVNNPDLINQNAEDTWIIKLKISNPKEYKTLLSKADYEALPK